MCEEKSNKKEVKRIEVFKPITFLNGVSVHDGLVDEKKQFCINFIDALDNDRQALKYQVKEQKEKIRELENRSESDHITELQNKIILLKQKNQQLEDELYMGFTKEDLEKVDQWREQHKNKDNKKFRHSLTWVITPTELGLIKEVRCGCGAICDLTKNNEFG